MISLRRDKMTNVYIRTNIMSLNHRTISYYFYL